MMLLTASVPNDDDEQIHQLIVDPNPQPTTSLSEPPEHCNDNNKPPSSSSVSIPPTEALLRFLLLPSQIYIILLLEFLNTFRSYGLRIVIYNYITNEYSLVHNDNDNDNHDSVTNTAGRLLGIKSCIDILAGLIGCILVDFWGVRKLSLVALSIATVSRAILAFGRTKTSLCLALLVGSPLGDALLSIGLYRVALKKLTTPKTRAMAFAVSYGIQNLAGVCVALLLDWMRRRGRDITLDYHYDGWNKARVGIYGVFTPVRQFVVLTWLVVLLTFVIAFLFLKDLTVIDSDDPDDDFQANVETDIETESCISNKSRDATLTTCDDNSNKQHSTQHQPKGQCSLIETTRPMFNPEVLKSWFPRTYHQTITKPNSNNGCNYKTFHTIHAKAGIKTTPSIQSIWNIIQQLLSVLRLRNSWRVIVFSFATILVSLQWTASDLSLPPFLERRFGENIPIYTIQNIHMMGSMILPPFVGALTTGKEDFAVIIPGLWIMALSPMMLVLSPTIFGACAWQIVLTMGQILWSPRQDSWVASLAPTGMEGLFFAVSNSRALLVPLGDFVMSWMNEKYNTNCSDCRDVYGHFCDRMIMGGDNRTCSSVHELCETLYLDSDEQTCPKTCNECPTWEYSDPTALWLILLSISIVSPLLVWSFLPFLRGR